MRDQKSPVARWGRHCLAAILVAGLVSANSTGAAQPITPRAALERLMTASHYQASWFAPVFLAQVSPAQLEQGRAAILSVIGPYVRIEPRPDRTFSIVCRKGIVVAQIHLDNQGRIDGLFFGALRFTGITVAMAAQSLRRLPGRVSLLVTRNGKATAAINSGQLLAVGSAFKLAVLLAIRHQIAAGKLTWTKLVTLHEGDRSYSSAALQNQPAGARLTVATLAADMISASDNTAADLLIHLAGRAAIDPIAPAQDRPFLTTHEAFVLKAPAQSLLRQRYLHGNPAQRLAILAEVDRMPLPPLSAYGGGLLAPEVEWFFSTRQLCALMRQVHDLPAMSLNPGVADTMDWKSVAYKGGSEPGVLNLTTLVTAHNGSSFCVSATWNNAAPLDETLFEATYGGLLHALSRQGR
jgi:beta-lactamase class A